MNGLIPDKDRGALSLPIILISAACGIAGGILGIYIGYIALDLSVQWSAALGTLALCFGLGGSGALLSSLTDSHSAFGNIVFSCGLVLLSTIFLGLCTLVGAVMATLMLT